MKLDNLFIVESPLQALVALELSLQFSHQKNGVIYRLSGKDRKRNDQQILNVLKLGRWDHISSVVFNSSSGLAHHWSVRVAVIAIKEKFHGNVGNLFFGEFRSRWMHLVRAVVSAKHNVLMDDGAATITAKRNYLDNLIYFPSDLWSGHNGLKDFAKRLIYSNLENLSVLREPISYASAFLRDESDYIVDYSQVKRKFQKSSSESRNNLVLFFGSKYSEIGIVSREYELFFIKKVEIFYLRSGFEFTYCAHRDESQEKLNTIQNELGISIRTPDLPAELYLLNCESYVSEISAAYSSVLNNLRLMFPEKRFRSFRIRDSEIDYKHRENIAKVYDYFDSLGIPIETGF